MRRLKKDHNLTITRDNSDAEDINRYEGRRENDTVLWPEITTVVITIGQESTKEGNRLGSCT